MPGRNPTRDAAGKRGQRHVCQRQENPERQTSRTQIGTFGATAIAAITVFAAAIAAPVTIDLGGADATAVSMKSAFARNGGGNGGSVGNDTAGDAAETDGDHRRVWWAPLSGPTVTRVAFTTEIRGRSPQDDIKELHDPDQYVTFFTDLRKMDGKQVTHRWSYQGVVKYGMAFDVMSDSWQAWSTQRLPADGPGEWTVEVIDENGKVLAAGNLAYLTTAADRAAENDPASGGFSGTMDRIRGLLQL